MTNKEWLDYLAHNAPDELAAWFDAEHVEHQDGTLDGDTEPENEDSRELILTDLEKKTREWHDYDGNYMRIYSGVAYAQMKELLDRQAAITEEKTRYKWVTASAEEIAAWRSKAEKLKEQVYELTAERDELQAKVDELKELNEYHALQYELASEDADRLQAQVDTLKSRHCPHYHVNEHTCDVHETRIAELTAERDKAREESVELYSDLVKVGDEREHYREKCSKMATIIHDALMVMDEGMA